MPLVGLDSPDFRMISEVRVASLGAVRAGFGFRNSASGRPGGAMIKASAHARNDVPMHARNDVPMTEDGANPCETVAL